MKSHIFIKHRNPKEEKNSRRYLIIRAMGFPSAPALLCEVSVTGQRAGDRMQSPEDDSQVSPKCAHTPPHCFLSVSGPVSGRRKNGNLPCILEFHIPGEGEDTIEEEEIINCVTCYERGSRYGTVGRAPLHCKL